MKKDNKGRTRVLFKLSSCFALLLIIFLLPQYSNKSSAAEQESSTEYCYLSDMNWSTGSRSGWGSLLKDTTSAGSKISVKVEGAYYTFDKGIWAHATSTVIYDLTTTPNGIKYDYFTAYIGLNQTAASSSNGVKFFIYTSADGTNWDLKTDANPAVFKAGTNADFVKIDIKDAKWLKLVADSNGANGNDHAVYADAKLIKETYKEPGEDLVPSLAELDEKIKTEFANADLATNKEYELTLLKREFVSNAGNYALRKFLSESEQNKEVYEWLTNDVENLRLYLVGGKPEGNYLNSLNVLTKLYNAHKDDLLNETVTEYGTVLGDLYRNMMLSISLTHSGNVYLWITGANTSDPVTRYEIYKKLYNENLIESRIFESLTVEEMRWVMNTVIDDEEIEWLNNYTRTVKNGATGPYSYIRYTFGYNYWKEEYYSEENYAKWNEKYKLSDYNVPYKAGNPKLWIVFEEGSVCGGLSKTGSCVWGSFKGLPNTCVSQPGHCAYIYYNQDANGNGIWGLGNDVSGWAQSGRTEHLNVRTMNDWGNGSYTSGWNASYILLAQAAQNEYKKYEKSEEILMLAKVYSNDKEKLNEIYRKALEEEEINFDAWYGLINLYKSDETKTEEDYYNLAEEIATTLTYYPRPMYDLLALIEPKLQSVAYSAKFTMLRTRTLTLATKVTNEESIQAAAVKQVANSLLGFFDPNVADFSFDGENGGAIVLSSKYDASDVQWDYSLDGGKTWTQTGEHAHKLTSEELASITSANDIKVHIIGVNYSEDNIFTIDIQESAGLPTNLYANDLENSIIGADSSIEWRYAENDEWTSYGLASPDLTGNKTIQLRQGATGKRLASNTSPVYTFTEDNQPDTRKYIRIAHLSIEGYSTQSIDTNRPFYAPNAIDGNPNTLWHTDFRYNVLQQGTKPFITIKLDKPRYISALEFIQKKYKVNDPDCIKNGIVYVSMDGEEWTEAGRIENCPQNVELRNITFNESVYGQYVKLEMETYNMFASLAMVNLFEDITKIEDVNPTAEIQYSTHELTNKSVIATLVNPSTEITITNNNGKDSYIFTENGEFTFEFEDANGNKGTAVATVNWIDKSGPTADVEYKLDSDKKLLILLDNISEDVYLLDEDNNRINYIEVDQNKKITSIAYLDNSGNTYKEIEIDENGNTKKITYKNTTGNVTDVATYVTTLKTEEDGNEEIKIGEVIKEEYFSNDGNAITITDEEKQELRRLQQTARSNPLEYALETSGDYEFKMLDKANNILYKSIKVDYINNDVTILASDITYDITKATNGNVVATINPYIINTAGKHENVEVVSEGGTTHTFTENGEFTFKYKNAADTENWEVKQHTAKVDWIDKTAPTAEIIYSTTETTDKEVIATLVNESEEIIITNNGTSREHIFTKNGEFTFEFEDEAGNKGTAVAKVDWILEDTTVTSDKYKVEGNYIIVNILANQKDKGITVKEFKDNITSSKVITVLNKDGSTLAEEDIIKSGMKLKVGDESEFTVIIKGDTDQDGMITVNDLAQLKLHYIKYELLTGESLIAADVDGDSEFTINDIARIKLIIISLI